MKLETEKLKYCNEALEIEKKLRKGFLVLAQYLYKIREGRFYEPQWSTFEEYMWEFKEISPATISKMISVYENYVVKFKFRPRKLEPIGWNALYTMLPVIKSKASAQRWIGTALVLSRQDLFKEIKEKRTGVDMSECKHEDFYEIRICRTCGDRWKNEAE